jgi:antitoxin VapB
MTENKATSHGLIDKTPDTLLEPEQPAGIYSQSIPEEPMAKSSTAKLFRNGRSQAVRLPREFRFEGDEVRIRRVAEGVLLEPLIPDTATWFAELDRLNAASFMKEGRRQPKTPRRKIFE